MFFSGEKVSGVFLRWTLSAGCQGEKFDVFLRVINQSINQKRGSKKFFLIKVIKLITTPIFTPKKIRKTYGFPTFPPTCAAH